MRPRSARVTHLALSARVAAQRFAFLALVTAALLLMLMSKGENAFVGRLRTVILDAAQPVLSVLSEPVAAVNRVVGEVNEVMDLRQENARLRRDIERLRSWETVARGLERENATMRGVLNVQGESQATLTLTARVIGDSGGPFVRTMLLDAGRRKGAQKGQTAVNGEGLVGRVVEAGERSARILLLTDLNSRVPVVVESSRYRAILAGDNSDRPRLIFLVGDARVRPGDRIVTSGHGGMFPAGLPVGVITGVVDGVPRVQPFVNWHRLEYVRLLEVTPPGPITKPGAGDPAGQW